MNFEKSYSKALQILNELPKDLHYHNADHTLSVLKAAKELFESEGLIDHSQLILLQTAAMYHDLGYSVQYHNNEPIACEIATKLLPLCSYSDFEISQINEMIMATQVPQKPQNMIQKILCDADLIYLGSKEFFTGSENLYKELESRNLISNRREWDQKQIDFLQNHRYWTESARGKCDQVKNNHLKNIQSRLDFPTNE